MIIHTSGRESFTSDGEPIIDAHGARWSRVVAPGGRPATLVEFRAVVAQSAREAKPTQRMEFPGDAAALFERLHALDPRTFVPVIAAGQSGETHWLVYEAVAEELDAPGPIASADLVTLGATVASALKTALDQKLPVPHIDHLWVTHEYDDEGTYRPRLLGVGVPGSRSEKVLTADLGRLLILAFVGRPAHLQLRSGEPISVDLTRSRGAVLASDLSEVLERAVSGQYERLVDLRRDLLAATALSAHPPSMFRPESEADTALAPLLAATPPWRAFPPDEHEAGHIVQAPRRSATRPWLVVALLLLAVLALVAALNVTSNDGDKPDSGALSRAPTNSAGSAAQPLADTQAPATAFDRGENHEPGRPNGDEGDTAADNENRVPDSTSPDPTTLITFELGTVPERALIYEGEAFIGHTPYRLTVRKDRLPMQLRLARAGYQPETLLLQAPASATPGAPALAQTRVLKLTPLPRSPSAPIILDR